VDSRVVYNLYDEWKRANAKGRLVDLDKLIDWCHKQSEDGVAKKRKRA
jgi:hypothetical protein